ncbi:hypothetical protein NA78x_006203 [Anatilimnocola sp. NA78]|uniref:hypothetical protein n=1 Tax=Anatilimnocola sp. NA78 TaxID=3415683 RepID=UPI003CE4E8E6
MSDSVLSLPPDGDSIAASAAEDLAAALCEPVLPEAVLSEPVAPAKVPVDLVAPHRSAAVSAVQAAHDLPPGVRQRLTSLVEQAANLNADGDPLLSTRQVLELLAQGLPPVLRREATTTVSQPVHPAGDAFFQVHSDELSDQQAEQIARTQLQRAGLLQK